VFTLLADPDGLEWRDKVGVVGRRDGSAKSTTRLLACGGWVCKTRLDDAFSSADAALHALEHRRSPGLAAAIWHPDKVWAALRHDDTWLPLTICRELATLRQIRDFASRTRSWTAMLRRALAAYREHRVGLDLNPANFATEREGGPLYYVDEELCEILEPRDVGGAIAARIPEEADVEPSAWSRWGSELRRGLNLGEMSWEDVATEMLRYPLPERYAGERAALHAALIEPAPSAARAAAEAPTCVIADVHANLAALEAVLADAEVHGARRVLFLGDAVGYGPEPGACVRRLRELRDLIAIRGNHDHAIANDRLELGMNSLARECALWTRQQLDRDTLGWLADLPTEHVGDHWLAVHGAPRDPHRFLAYVYELTYEDNLHNLRDRQVPVCFYGHTHVQLSHVLQPAGPSKLPGPRELVLDRRHHWLVNPGSVGQPRDGDVRAAYALWWPESGQLVTRRVAYDITRTITALRCAGLPGQLADRLRVGA
jgi:diadenosine tetraphosphatase ApaH/serine/threonine PP2A family protein phosphatase